MMHDWSLLSISVEWENGLCTFTFMTYPKLIKKLICEELLFINIPRNREWGPSISVLYANEITSIDGYNKIDIEMQTGDIITVKAKNIYIE